MEQEKCVKPARGPLVEVSQQTEGETAPREVTMIRAQVGKPAPDFELSGLVKGGFQNVKLSDYKGKWIVLCFYPGDFTFV